MEGNIVTGLGGYILVKIGGMILLTIPDKAYILVAKLDNKKNK